MTLVAGGIDGISVPLAAARVSRTGIKLGSIALQGSGQGLELVVRGAVPLAGVSRSLTFVEKQQPIYYQTIGYDAVAVYVLGSNPVSSLSRAALRGIYTGRIRSWKEVGGQDAPLVLITQIWSAQRAQMVEFRDQVMDGAAYREDRREVDRQADQVAALLAEPRGITAVSLPQGQPPRARGGAGGRGRGGARGAGKGRRARGGARDARGRRAGARAGAARHRGSRPRPGGPSPGMRRRVAAADALVRGTAA